MLSGQMLFPTSHKIVMICVSVDCDTFIRPISKIVVRNFHIKSDSFAEVLPR
jgi:hypothetical protein